MEFHKQPIVVRSFHYDLVTEEPKIRQDIQVTMRQVELQNKEDETGDAGNYFEIMVPFDISPNPGFFQISGTVTQVVQTIDYTGQANELPPETLELVSRPLVEMIETLTYQITSVALKTPVDITFSAGETPKNDQEENKN